MESSSVNRSNPAPLHRRQLRSASPCECKPVQAPEAASSSPSALRAAPMAPGSIPPCQGEAAGPAKSVLKPSSFDILEVGTRKRRDLVPREFCKNPHKRSQPRTMRD